MILLQNYLSGLALSNDGTTPNTKIDVAPGVAADSTNAILINLASAATIDFTTTGAGGLDAGSIAASTWYHCFVIVGYATVPSVLASTSPTPTMPSGYGYYRRVGSVKTDGSAHLRTFTQNGDEFIWASVVQDITTNGLSTTATLFTMNGVPPGLKMNALLRGEVLNAGSVVYLLISSPDENSVAPNATDGNLTAYSDTIGQWDAFAINVRTDANQRIRAVASASSSTLNVVTYGWIDTRGRFG